ncbi:MAG: NAD(P)/FAD-dependent oxidoreductase [Betaproteobacteria bacterium]
MRFAEDKLTRHSYYTASAPRPASHSPLASEAEADVCIVGGGIAGLSAALDLRARGYSVVLLEAREVGWGASGRNGGQALVGLACEMATIEQQLGREAARRVWAMTVEAIEQIHERRLAHGIDCDWQAGALAVAVNERKTRELHAACERLACDYGYDRVQPLARAELPRHIASPRYAGGAYDGFSGHLHPLKYTLGLARAAAAAGVHIHEGSAALRYDAAAQPVVHTAGGRVRCRHLLLAGNVYLNSLAPALARRIMPVGTFIAASHPLGRSRADALLPTRAAVADTQFVLDYFRLLADDRLLFGGRVSYSTVAPPNLPLAMRRRMLHVFPQLADVGVDYWWGGYVDITMNRAPDFGRLAPDVYYLQGFSGHGLALAGLAGRLAAEAMAGAAERFDLFARLKHRDFPGGRWLRTPALVLAMAWYRLRDALG